MQVQYRAIGQKPIENDSRSLQRQAENERRQAAGDGDTAPNAPEATQRPESDNSGHLCARTKKRLKTANMKPETVNDSETVQRTTPRPSERQEETETATSTANQGRRPAEKRPSDTQTETVKRSEFFTVSTLPETETRAVYGSEPSQVSKPPAWP